MSNVVDFILSMGMRFFYLIFLLVPTINFAKPTKFLSQADLYEDIKTKTVKKQNIAYSPQYPLWTDGAKKSRWIFLPPNTQIDTSKMEQWQFPVGTRFWKEFRFWDEKKQKEVIIETRLMEKIEEDPFEGWKFYTYVWNEEQTDALLDLLGKGKLDGFNLTQDLSHQIPNRTDCMSCHISQSEPVLGFSALQLSWERDSLAIHKEELKNGAFTLSDFMKHNLVTHKISQAPQIRASNKEAKAVLGYLHSNCAPCHNEGGKASFTGLRFHYELGVDEKNQPVFRTAVNQRNSQYKETDFRIDPGNPNKSSVLTRMTVKGAKFPRMPYIGTQLVDEQAVKAISKWIENLR